jgi:hypothetical protein
MVLLAESAARLTEAHHAYLTTIAVCAGKRADAVDQTASSSFRVAQIGDRIINIQVFKPGPYNRFGALGALLADWNVSPAAASVPRTSASGVGLSGRKSQRSPDRPLHGKVRSQADDAQSRGGLAGDTLAPALRFAACTATGTERRRRYRSRASRSMQRRA